MRAGRRIGRDSASTRQAILEATEQLMREEGYAAVSSRRVADRAGLKSQLVHYHFGTMDELFLAVYRRAEEDYLAQLLQALTAPQPISRLWKFSREADTGLVAEFIALAIHRKAVRDEIARSNDRVRAIQSAVLSKALTQAGISAEDLPAEVLAFLIAALSRTLVTETALGASAGHSALLAFVERRLLELEGGPRS